MPIVTGALEKSGAVIDLLIGVGRIRQSELLGLGQPIPQPIAVRALIDTGATISGFTASLFADLNLTEVGKTTIYTPSTPANAPFRSSIYRVSLSIVAEGRIHPFPESNVIASEGWGDDENLQGLIGCDLLAHCNFIYLGPTRRFTLAF